MLYSHFIRGLAQQQSLHRIVGTPTLGPLFAFINRILENIFEVKTRSRRAPASLQIIRLEFYLPTFTYNIKDQEELRVLDTCLFYSVVFNSCFCFVLFHFQYNLTNIKWFSVRDEVSE